MESGLHEAPQLLSTAGMAQLAQRLRFDLADTLARDLEIATDLFEGVVALLADAEAHAQDLLLARRQRLEHATRLLLEVEVQHGVRGRDRVLVLDEVAEVAVLLFADGRLEADGLLGDLEHLAHAIEGISMRSAISSGLGSRPSS